MKVTDDDVLGYIIKYRKEHEYSPTIRELCAGLGIKSTSTVKMHVDRLVFNRRLRKGPGARTLVPCVGSEDA